MIRLITLDWSYNYHANNLYQQVAQIEIYVKTTTATTLSAINKQPHIHISICVHL